jgi:hypothetical protein
MFTIQKSAESVNTKKNPLYRMVQGVFINLNFYIISVN